MHDRRTHGNAALVKVSGTQAGTFTYFENTGSAEAAAFTAASNPLAGQSVVSRSSATLGDLDGDGDLDLLSGATAGTTRGRELLR